MSFFLVGNTEQNCALLLPDWVGWDNWLCEVPPEHPIKCACENGDSVYLKLRNASKFIIDTFIIDH